MSKSNKEIANKAYNDWPNWKRDFSITKYSTTKEETSSGKKKLDNSPCSKRSQGKQQLAAKLCGERE